MSGSDGSGVPGVPGYGGNGYGAGDAYGSGHVSNGQTGEGPYGDGAYGDGTYGDPAHGDGEYGHGGWQPTSQGDYDADATAFVSLPEGLADTPLAAPGGSFVPPQISVVPGAAADPAATGTFVIPSLVPQMNAEPAAPEPAPAPVRWPEPNAPQEPAPRHEAGMTGQWSFTQGADGEQPAAADAGAHGQVTGQWSIPLAQGDLPDESGEFTQSALVDQWAERAPAKLPGGASAPWVRVEEPAAAEAQAPGDSGGPDTSDGGAEQPAAPEAEATQPADQPADEPSDQPDAASSVLDADDPAAPSAPPSAFGDEHPLASYVLRVNGADRPVADAWIGESLLYVLRERLGLAGAKDGCSQGECGACAVQVDGRLVASCLVPAATAAGAEVRTVEGLAEDGQPSDVQRALAASCAVQCGFCVPGMAMTVHDLLEGNPQPSEREARQALCGNLCRCTGYKGVLEAVKDVVAERQASAPDEDDQARIPHQAPPGAGGVNYPQDGGPA
ncbi:2Fe-2S iron-sulfur cluster-binding protein [Streptomyces sp. NPDC050418]|uniref:2Fe-2S iron-sulfur cluster-binding protein n=1 Tax=Streptomyces sp. NPDC050418 TaxID=3365612 RepID=UPI0037A9006C